MALVVIDSSVAVKWFVAEPLSDKASEILDALDRKGLEIVVPDLMYAEVSNVLWKKHLQQGLDLGDCRRILAELQSLLLPVVPITRLFTRAFDLAAQHRRTVYDMLYVSLAEREGCSFVTADEKLVNAIRGPVPYVIWLANWP